MQDTWRKITRRLTLDYGLRYDLHVLPGTVWPHGDLAPNLPNPTVGGVRAVQYEAT